MRSSLRLVTDAVAAHPVLTLVILAVMTLGFGSLIPEGEISNDNAAFSPDSPEIDALNEIEDRFRDSNVATMQVIVRGDDVVTADGLATANFLVERATEVFGDTLLDSAQGPAIVSWLQGVVQVAAVQGMDPTSLDDATVKEFQAAALGGAMAPPPGAAPTTGGDPAALLGQLVGGDDPTEARAGLVLVQLDRSRFPDQGSLADLQRVYVAEVDAADLPLEVIPFSFALVQDPGEDFQREIGQLFGIAALVILVVLALVLRARRGRRLGWFGSIRRSVADMALSMVTVLLAITWTQGLLVMLGPDGLGIMGQASPPTQLVPILLLALGVDYAIHLQSRYREELADGDDPATATRRLGNSVGVALFLSMLTTAIGFLANAFSPIPAIRDLGVLAAAGIVSVFVLTITFLPAVRMLLDRRAGDDVPREELARPDGALLTRFANLGLRPALRGPTAVLGVVGVLAAAGAYGLTQLDTVFSVTAFLPEGSPEAEAYETLTEEFGGGLAESTDALVTGDLLTSEVHNAYADMADRLTGVEGVVQFGGRPALTTPVSALATAAATATPGAQADALDEALALGLSPDGTVADGTDVAALYTLMAPVFPDVAATVDVDAVTPAVRLQARTQSETVGTDRLEQVFLDAVVPVSDAGADVIVTSEAILNAKIIRALSSSQVRGLIVVVAVVMALLALVYFLRQRRPGLGALIVLPVTVVLLWTFGMMAAFGIPFDPVTAVMSALIVGIGVDFCIHLGERFVEDLEEHDGDPAPALTLSLQHTGAALAGSAATTTLGMAVLTTTSIIPFQRLGTVALFAITMSLLATIFVLPPILVLYARRQFPQARAASVAAEERVPVGAST